MTNEAEVNRSDRLWALLCWLPWVGWILAIIALLTKSKRDRPFIRYNAVQALISSIVPAILSAVLSPSCVGSLVILVLWLGSFYNCFRAYRGTWIKIPFITNFFRNRGWI
ncbi:MAG: DUF4870 domain-containing protein [Gammaproteobacteria bacterium]|jgi:uncharacterized membrane protein